MKRNGCELLIAFTKYCVWEFGDAIPTDEQIYNYFTENQLAEKYYSPENLIDDVNCFFQMQLEIETE